MANNIDAVIPQLLVQGLMKLRANAVVPALVNRGYDEVAGRQGSTIDVPLPVEIGVTDVAPSANQKQASDTVYSSVSVPVDQWKEASFYMTDKDMVEVQNGTIPAAAEAAIVALCDYIDLFCMKKMGDSAYNFVGTPGTTPLSDGKTKDITQAGKLLNIAKAPASNRNIVMDPAFQASALEIRAFQDISWGQSRFVIAEGAMPRRLGFDFYMDQNVYTHEKGAVGTIRVNKGAGYAVGDTQIVVDGATSNPKKGDVFTLAGNDQTYVVKEYSTGNNTITFSPGLVAAAADNTVLTFKNDHVVNLAFHRDAFVFVSRPLSQDAEGFGNKVFSQTDPISDITLRLEVVRQHKQLKWSYDILFGGQSIRPEHIVRIAG